MNKIISKIKSNKIISIILLAFILNTIGILYAFPLLRLVNDETAIVSTVLKMINDFSLRPNFVDNYYLAPVSYIYLPFYLLYFAAFFLFGIVHSVAELKELVLLDYASFNIILPLARFISVIFSCLSVYLVYKISRTLFKENKGIALWGSFFTATNLMFVQLSHFGRIWIIQIFFILLGFYYLSLMMIEKRNSFKNYLISGVLMALSFGIHIIGAIIYICFLFVHYVLNKGRRFTDVFLKNKKFWLANLVILLVVAGIHFLHPYALERYFDISKGHLVVHQASADDIYTRSDSPPRTDISVVSSLLDGLTQYIPILLEYGPILIILFLISLPSLFLRQRKAFYLLASFIVSYYLFIGPFLKIDSIRYILPIIPFLSIVAGYGFFNFLQRYSSKYFKNILSIIFIILFLFMPLYWDIGLLKPNTYVMAKQWVENNLSNGEMIINFELDNRLILNENKESLILLSEFMPKSVSARERYLLTLDEKEYPQPNYFILYRPEKMPEDFLIKNKFNYLIINWWDKKEKEILEEKITKLNYNLELIQKFHPNEAGVDLTDLVNEMRRPLQLLKNIRYTGPYIEIYKIN